MSGVRGGRRVMVELCTGDWWGPVRVSTAILATAGVLAVVLGLAMRPAVPGAHWQLRTTLVLLSVLWNGAFGADLTGEGSFQGLTGSAGIGMFPLTITLAAYAAGVWLFRRDTRGLTTLTAVLGFAARTALLTAIPPLVVAWTVRAPIPDLLQLGGLPPDADALGIAGHAGVSAVGSFFLTLLLTAVVLGAAVLLRGDLFTGTADGFRAYLVGPITGAAVLATALLPAGLIGAVFVWLLRPAGSGSLTAHQWVDVAAGVIAYAPDIGLWMVSLGSLGRIGGGVSSGLGPVDASRSHGLHFWAAQGGLDRGMWASVALAPVVLALTAYAVVWLARRGDTRERLRTLATWVVSLLVVLPCLVHVASLHAHASASGLRVLGPLGGDVVTRLLGIPGLDGTVPDHVSAHASAGPTTASVFLIAAYALVVAAVAAVILGLVRRQAFRRTGEAS